jgi:hypothetical protein
MTLALLTLLLTIVIPLHIPTWAYDEYGAQGSIATSTQVQRYVTYAEGGLGNAKAVKDCGGAPKSCYSVWYFDPKLVYDSPLCPFSADSQFVASSSEDWYVHERGFNDSAHRLAGSYSQFCKGAKIKVPVYVTNVANPAVVAYFNTYLRKNADAWSYYLWDDAAATVHGEMYGPNGSFCRGMTPNGWCVTTQEIADDTALLQAQARFAGALRHANGAPMEFFANGDPTLLQTSGQFIGAVCENCVVNAGTFRTDFYATVLNKMAAVEALPDRKFVLLNTGNAPAGSSEQIDQRIVTTAVVWLGDSDGRTVAWPDLEYNTNNLAVWPEDEIVPTDPLESMAGSASEIAVAPGVWRREFRACYDAGKPIGPCAALLNANADSVTVQSAWLKVSYGHVILLEGGDILNAGSFSLSSTPFVPNRTTISGGRALLLAR